MNQMPLLAKSKNGEAIRYYENTQTKRGVRNLLRQAKLHVENPEKYSAPQFIDNLDAYAVIKDILGM